MTGSPSLLALSATVALTVYLSLHHLALAGRTGSGRIHLGIGLFGACSLAIGATRFVHYVSSDVDVVVVGDRIAIAMMWIIQVVLVFICREFAGEHRHERALRGFTVGSASVALLCLCTPWAVDGPATLYEDALGQHYLWVHFGPLSSALGVIGPVCLLYCWAILGRASRVDGTMRALLAVGFVIYVGVGLNDYLLSLGRWRGVILFEHGYLVLAVVFDALAVRRFRALSRSLELEVARRTDELSQKNVALGEALKDAGVASRAKSAFVANMSHEIRTPLNGVVGLLDVLARTNLDGAQRDYMRTMRASADALMALCDQLEVGLNTAAKT